MKVPFVEYELAKRILFLPPIRVNDQGKMITEDSGISTRNRASTIIENLLGRTISVHNGYRAKKILIRHKMIGFKLGSFVRTKKQGKSIHNSVHNRRKAEKQRRKITQKKIRRPAKTKSKSKTKSKTKKK